RLARAVRDQIRAGDQPEDSKGARPRRVATTAVPRRRGDRMTGHTMHRRSFLTLLGASAAAWPLAARGPQDGRVRGIGVLTGDETDPEGKRRYSAFTQALAGLGWTDDRNVRMERRLHGGDINRMRALAQELVGLQPDIIVTAGTPATVALQRETRTI